MSHSVLLQIARESIQEVLQAQRTIDKNSLLQQHPLLAQKVPLTLNLFIEEVCKGSYSIQTAQDSLLNNIIIAAKKAAFEDKEQAVFTTSAYLHCEVELILQTPEGIISERDRALIQEHSLRSISEV